MASASASKPKHAAWMMGAVALVAFGIGEGGRLLLVSLEPTRVQWHRTFLVSSEPLVPVWLAILVVAFVWLRLGDKGLASGVGLYVGGALCNLSELAWLGGVANCIPAFGYVFSFGDVSASAGCLFAFPSILKHSCRVWLVRQSAMSDPIRHARPDRTI